MPIHDQGYRRYGGSRSFRGGAWWVIARAGIKERIRERRFLGLLLFAWSPFIVRAVQIYVAANVRQASFLAPTANTFREFLDQQGIFVFFVTIYVGAGAIASDRRVNALQIYLSKPLTRVEYVAGKLATLVVFALVNLSLLRLRHRRLRSSGPHVRVPLWVPAAGLATCIAMIASAFIR